jgi:uncharacterized protein (DUF1697 family)
VTTPGRYIALLRGINVSGQRIIPMEALRASFEGMKFTAVSTYIQSGNVFFSAPPGGKDSELSRKIARALLADFGFEVTVVIRSLLEIKKILAENPFLKEKNGDINGLHVTFLEDYPAKEKTESLMKFDFTPDRFVLSGKEVYIYCPNGYGKTKINNSFFESKLKVQATTRNWKTVIKLEELAQT